MCSSSPQDHPLASPQLVSPVLLALAFLSMSPFTPISSLLKSEGISLEGQRNPYSAPILAPAFSVWCFSVTLVDLVEVSDPAGAV